MRKFGKLLPLDPFPYAAEIYSVYDLVCCTKKIHQWTSTLKEMILTYDKNYKFTVELHPLPSESVMMNLPVVFHFENFMRIRRFSNWLDLCKKEMEHMREHKIPAMRAAIAGAAINLCNFFYKHPEQRSDLIYAMCVKGNRWLPFDVVEILSPSSPSDNNDNQFNSWEEFFINDDPLPDK